MTARQSRRVTVVAGAPPGRLAFEPAEPAEDLPWQDLALCAEVDAEIFFPEKGGSAADGKRICLSCEVRTECLEYALAHDERFGIWGGLSERQRRDLKRKRSADQAEVAA